LFALLLQLSVLLGCGPRQRVTPQPPTEPPGAIPTPTAEPTVVSRPTPSPLPTVVLASPVPETPRVEPIRAKIEVVWPHDEAPVREATQANITAYLMAVDANRPPPCDWEPTVRLWQALNAGPARPIAVGEKRMLVTGGRSFPVWDFNDIDVSAARDPSNKLSFYVTVDDVRTYHNVWVHAQDARTILAQPDIPTNLLATPPAAVDARIEIVWPHDGLPVEQAELANITAFPFEAGTLSAISADAAWNPAVRLHRALNADAESPSELPVAGKARAVELEGGDVMLAWDFNDVDVRAAQDRLNKIYFWVSVEGIPTFPNVWAHGADTPTVFPQVDVLESCR
jgi:hypothetical protein